MAKFKDSLTRRVDPLDKCSLSVLRIHIVLVLLDPDPDPLVRGMDPDPDPDLVSSHIKQK